MARKAAKPQRPPRRMRLSAIARRKIRRGGQADRQALEEEKKLIPPIQKTDTA
jgi:hypothetical protein